MMKIGGDGMFGNDINFPMISKALSLSMDLLSEEESFETAREKLVDAQKEFHQALSFSAANKVK
jgi:hypothetical protein